MCHLSQGMIAAVIAGIAFSSPAMAEENQAAVSAPEATAPTENDTAATPATSAVHHERLLHLVGTAGLSLGGDTIATVRFSNGHEEKITAGGLMYIAAGLGVDIPHSNWSAQILGGYHFNGSTASNGDLTFDRNTLDEQLFYRFGGGNHRIGGGLVQHFSPEFSAHIDGLPDQNTTFDDAKGYSVEYNWLPVKTDLPFKESRLGFSLRAVFIDYEAKTVNGLPAQKQTLSGNHVAAGVYVYL